MALSDAYKDKADAQKDQWEAKIKELTAKAREATSDVRIGIEKQIADIRAKMDSHT